MKRITIQEIAEKMGLSRNTVSKALSGQSEVSLETRLQVVKVATELGYPLYKINMPESTTFSQLESKKKSVLILSKREHSSFWNRIILGISDVLNAKHIAMRLLVINEEDEKKLTIPFSDDHEITGIIVMSVFSVDYIEKLSQKNIPLVFLDAPVHAEQYLKFGDIILSEGYHSMRLLTEHLIKQGMRRFCFIADCTYCRTIADRFKGFSTALMENNISLDDQLLFIDHKPERYYTYDEVSGVIDELPFIPDAIVCGNDDIAKDVYKKLSLINLHIPKDIAVTGFDNSEAADILSPGLTTVAVHNQSMGRRLAIQLLYRIENTDTPKEMIYVAADLCIMESSAKEKSH